MAYESLKVRIDISVPFGIALQEYLRVDAREISHLAQPTPGDSQRIEMYRMKLMLSKFIEDVADCVFFQDADAQRSAMKTAMNFGLDEAQARTMVNRTFSALNQIVYDVVQPIRDSFKEDTLRLYLENDRTMLVDLARESNGNKGAPLNCFTPDSLRYVGC